MQEEKNNLARESDMPEKKTNNPIIEMNINKKSNTQHL